MKNIILNGTSEKISAVSLGTDCFGSWLDDESSIALLDEYCELGGNVLDTASLYGGQDEHLSEKLLGRWMKDKKNRDSIFISTKGAHPRRGQMLISRLSDMEIKSDMDKSLKNLGVDYVDIYWLHRDDERLPVEPIMNTLADLVKSGKTRYIGMSNWTHKRIDEANQYAKKNNLPMIISSQIQYSVAKALTENNDPTLVLMDDDEYNYFTDNDLSVFAFASQAKGFFSQLDAGGIENLSEKSRGRYLSEENIKTYDRIKELSERKGISVTQAVIAVLVNDMNFQTIPIIGARKIEHLRQSLSGADISLSQADCDAVLMRGNPKKEKI